MTDPIDHGMAAQQAAEEHLMQCWESLDNLDVDPETLAPFCGCVTCEVREVLHAAWPHLVSLWNSEDARENDGPS